MIVLVVGAFLLGWGLRGLGEPPGAVLRAADAWVLRVALPSMVVAKMSRIEIGADLVVPIAAAWAVMASCVAAILAIARLFRWSRPATGAMLLVAVLGNTSFLGLGVVEGMLGHGFLESAVAYDQPGTFLALATWGAFVGGRWGAGESGWRPVVRRLVRFAPFLALVVSVPIRSTGLPTWAWDVLDSLGSTVAPVAMAALGLRFHLRVDADVARRVAVGLGVKMLMAPALVVVAATVAGGIGEPGWRVAVVQASAPPMVTAGLVAVAAGLEERTVTAMVGLGTLVGLVWMPVVALLV